jgi:protein TonB
MRRKKPDNPYEKMLSHRRWGVWILAGAGALALNLALFGMVPYLIDTDPEIKSYEKIASGVDVIRIKPPEPEEPDEPEPKKPDEPEEKEPKPEKAPEMKKPVETQMSLPFEVNPRLPAGPGTLKLPEMMISKISLPGHTFAPGELDKPLAAVSRIPPTYPLRAKRNNIEGWVKVRFVINKQGRVEDITIIDEDPPGVFDQAVINCVSKWRFKPGTVGGVEVRTAAETTVRFQLD